MATINATPSATARTVPNESTVATPRFELTQVNARVMGVVVNAVDLQSPDLSYHYYYGSKYGGSYYEDGAARN